MSLLCLAALPTLTFFLDNPGLSLSPLEAGFKVVASAAIVLTFFYTHLLFQCLYFVSIPNLRIHCLTWVILISVTASSPDSSKSRNRLMNEFELTGAELPFPVLNSILPGCLSVGLASESFVPPAMEYLLPSSLPPPLPPR